MALPTQWGLPRMPPGRPAPRQPFRLARALELAHRRNPRQARREAGPGLMRWHNEYNVGTLQRPGLERFTRPRMPSRRPRAAKLPPPPSARPMNLIKTIKNLMEVSGGVGTIVGFVHDWANPENTRRSWDMVARYVIPEITAMSPACASRRNS